MPQENVKKQNKHKQTNMFFFGKDLQKLHSFTSVGPLGPLVVSPLPHKLHEQAGISHITITTTAVMHYKAPPPLENSQPGTPGGTV